jgi:hypothetical protein
MIQRHCSFVHTFVHTFVRSFSYLSGLSCAVILALSACGTKHPGENRVGIDPRPEVAAPRMVNDSFSIAETLSDGPILKVDRARISIHRSALDKEFLLQGALIPQATVAMGEGLKSRVVAFRKRQDKLYLMEATQGHTVTEEMPQNLLLAEFPLLDESESFLTFDFNAGMSNLFVYGDWHGHDDEGSDYKSDENFKSVPTRVSYIEEAKFDARNRLVIRQIAQVQVPSPSGFTNAPVEVRYYLSPYRPDQSYEPLRSPRDFDRMGFFEVAPQLTKTGTSAVFAARFHPQKPIIYAISSNTPIEYRQAVKDGILYWNKAFGRDIVQVVDAPADVRAHDPNYNVVQWINWDQAGFAYADAQMDPRSGEVLHAQVFMTSAFVFGGKTRARKILRDLHAGTSKKRALASRLGLKGFTDRPMCGRQEHDGLLHSLTELLASDADEAAILKASQDYVREVAAHEIGHTLGLRHNFAGSTAANYALADRARLVKTYFETKAAPVGVITSSSVMEYQNFEESVITGDQIARGNAALEYDQKAIAALYQGRTYKNSELPLFCTDSHLTSSGFTDCHEFDAGASSIEYANWWFATSLNLLPTQLIETYIAAKAPAFDEPPTAVDEVKLMGLETWLARATERREELFRSFTTTAALLRVHRLFPAVGPFNEDLIQTRQFSYFDGEVKRLGGLTAVWAGVPDDFAEKTLARFSALLESPHYASGIGANGKHYSFSKEEMDIMRANVREYSKKLETALILKELAILNGETVPTESAVHGAPEAPGTPVAPGKIVDHALGEALATVLQSRIETYVLATTGEYIDSQIEVPADPVEPEEPEESDESVESAQPAGSANSMTPMKQSDTRTVKVRLPKFRYPLKIRAAAAKLLRFGRGQSPEWGIYERAQTLEKFNQLLQVALTVPLEDIQTEKVPRPVARWVLENSGLVCELSGGLTAACGLTPPISAP